MSKYYPVEDTFLNASRGLIKGGSVRNIFGKALGTGSIVTAEYRTPWELASNYAFPTAASVMSIVSTSETDDSQILVSGLDINFEPVSQVVTLTGLTPVITTVEFYRINDLVELSDNLAGDVTASAGGTVYGKIISGTGKMQSAHYTVPAGHCFYLYRIDAFATDSNGGKAAFFRNYVGNNTANTIFRVAETQFFNNMNIVRRFPFKYDQKSDIKLQLKSSSGSIDGSIFAEGLLLAEPLGG